LARPTHRSGPWVRTYRRYSQHYLEQTTNPQGELAYGLLYGVPRAQMDDGGVLTDLMLPVSDTVTVNIGGRVDLCKASLDASDPIAAQTDDYTPRYGEPSSTLGMAYITTKKMLTDQTSLRAGVAFAMRSPDLTELYNYEAFVPQYRFGNTYNDGLSTLRPEKDLQFDLVSRIKARKPATHSGFWRHYPRLHLPSPCYVDQVPKPQNATYLLGRNFAYFPADQRSDTYYNVTNADTCQANYVYVNIDEVAMLGGDLFGEYQVRDGFSVFGNMSYVYGVNNSPVSVEQPYPYYSTTSVLVPSTTPTAFRESIALRQCGNTVFPSRPRIVGASSSPAEWSAPQDHVAVTLSEIPAPGYTTFNAKAYYRVRKNVRVSLDIENLLNRAYTEPGSLAIIGPNGLATFVEEPGISALMGVEARF